MITEILLSTIVSNTQLPSCRASVCDYDPFCCEVIWDSACNMFRDGICTCPADLNGDGVADGSDLAMVLTEWGNQDNRFLDLDSNGIVGGSDLGILISYWGYCN